MIKVARFDARGRIKISPCYRFTVSTLGLNERLVRHRFTLPSLLAELMRQKKTQEAARESAQPFYRSAIISNGRFQPHEPSGTFVGCGSVNLDSSPSQV
jgi:hypothetical protein